MPNFPENMQMVESIYFYVTITEQKELTIRKQHVLFCNKLHVVFGHQTHVVLVSPFNSLLNHLLVRGLQNQSIVYCFSLHFSPSQRVRFKKYGIFIKCDTYGNQFGSSRQVVLKT
jgi:hypothetical protein